MRTLPLAVLALLASFVGPLPARAVEVCAPLPPAGIVRTGDTVRTVVPHLPAGTREFELVLVREDGREIQVSPELPAGVRDVAWRMPRTAGFRARLALRIGGEGTESRSPRSAWFRLAPPAAEDVRRLAAGGEESPASFGAGTECPAGMRGASRPEAISPGAPAPVAAEAGAGTVPLPGRASERVCPARLDLRTSSPGRACGPARVPLRI